jgi:hypothetical protein
MKKNFTLAANLLILLTYFLPTIFSQSSDEYGNKPNYNYNQGSIITLLSVKEMDLINKNSQENLEDFNKNYKYCHKHSAEIIQTYNTEEYVFDSSTKFVYFSEETIDNEDFFHKNNFLDYKMEEIVNNSFFLNYTTLINQYCRRILNTSENEAINYTLVDNLIHKFVIHKKGSDTPKALRNYKELNNDILEYSYIYLINTKILYYNYQIYSREFTDNSIYYWDIHLEDMMADTDFLNSTHFNRTQAISVINAFSTTYNVKKNDYNQIDYTVRNLVQSNYENKMFNRTGLSEEEKDMIRNIILMKRNYRNFLLLKKLRELEYLEKNIGMEMIENDTQYIKKINFTEWNRIEQIGRKFTNNGNLSEKVNWREFDRIFAKYKLKYTDSEVIVNDDFYIGFKEIALFERDYYVWKKNKIENPVSPKKVKSQITNPASDSLFTDIGKNIHDSLQPLALAKVSENRGRYDYII